MTSPLPPPASAAGMHPVHACRTRRARHTAPTTPNSAQAVTPPEALWRYGVISSFLHGASTDASLRKRLQMAASQQWVDPNGQTRPIPAETLRHWIYRYRKGGIQALADKIRRDKGVTQVGDEMIQALAKLREEFPTLTTQRLLSLLRERKVWDGRDPSRSAIYRAVQTRGLQRRGEIDTHTAEQARAFAYDQFGQMWTADFLHGPTVREGNKPSQKLYLLAIIDDATRFVVHAHFYTTEGLVALVHGLSEAITRFGIPERFYTDNGSAFRTLHLQTIAARLGFFLPHTPAYRPQGRGKIERFFGTLRRQFLDGATASSRQEWNLKLRAWIDQYHHTKHDTLQATPLERRLGAPSSLRPFHGVADPLKKAFLLEARRKVRRDGTVLLDGATWDVPGALPGEVVDILHAPWVPEQILVGPDHKVAKPVNRIANAKRFERNPVRGNARHKANPDTHKERNP